MTTAKNSATTPENQQKPDLSNEKLTQIVLALLAMPQKEALKLIGAA